MTSWVMQHGTSLLSFWAILKRKKNLSDWVHFAHLVTEKTFGSET